MSLLVAGLVGAGVASALAASRWFARKDASSEPTRATPEAPAPAVVPKLDGFPCQIGDVVLGSGREEAWLAGALVFDEGVPVAALFVAPEAGGDRVVFATPAPAASLAWLAAVSASDVVAGFAEPPTALEIDGVRYERTRRRPLRITRAGVVPLDLGESAILAEYAGSAGERLVVVLGKARTVAFQGEALVEGAYEVIPSGGRTLEDVTPPASS